MQLLAKQGWQPRSISLDVISDDFIATRHGVGFVNENTAIKYLDLHWYLMPESCSTEFDDKLFLNRVSTQLHGVNVYGLDPANMLIHICVHGAKASPVPLIRWIMDAYVIIQNSQHRLHWVDLIESVTTRRVMLPIREALKYLRHNFQSPIPEHVLDKLEDLPVSTSEQREFYLRTSKHTNYIIASAACIWYKHTRLMQHKNFILRVFKFPFYLRKYWGLKSIFSLPLYLSYKFTKTLKSMWQAANK